MRKRDACVYLRHKAFFIVEEGFYYVLADWKTRGFE
jgi:hypothetical protein